MEILEVACGDETGQKYSHDVSRRGFSASDGYAAVPGSLCEHGKVYKLRKDHGYAIDKGAFP
jgi:hypothetical protein